MVVLRDRHGTMYPSNNLPMLLLQKDSLAIGVFPDGALGIFEKANGEYHARFTCYRHETALLFHLMQVAQPAYATARIARLEAQKQYFLSSLNVALARRAQETMARLDCTLKCDSAMCQCRDALKNEIGDYVVPTMRYLTDSLKAHKPETSNGN